MGAVKAAVVDMGTAALTLAELYASKVNFALTSEAGVGFSWYLVNTSGPYEQEDWIFHALRRGTGATFEEAVEQLSQAVVIFYPLSDFARACRLRRKRASK